MKSKNIEEVGVWLNGWRMVGVKKPILSLADLKGLKIWVTPGKAYVATFKALGADDIKKMEAAGAQFHTLPQAELDKWQHIIQTNVWPQFQDAIGKKLLDDVIALGKKYQWATPSQ